MKHSILHHKNQSFALVVTISLMVLLSLLAVGLLSLSTITLRARGGPNVMTEARGNARLTLLMLKDSDLGRHAFSTPEAAVGSRFAGIPGYVIQSDLLKPIANTLSVRDDTFRIRAYGDSIDENGKVLARAWCEAIVQRVPEYTDASNDPEVPAREIDPKGDLIFLTKVQDLADFKGGDRLFINLISSHIRVRLGGTESWVTHWNGTANALDDSKGGGPRKRRLTLS